ncbi:MAG: TonB-dependent receptor [bacterium]
MRKCLAFLFASLFVFSAAAASAQDVFDVGPVIVTAERIPVPESKITPNVSVITSDDIASSGAQSLGDLLQTYAGITYQQSGSLGKLSDIRLRGSKTSQLLYLVDGVKINDPSNGTVNMAILSLDDVERVEVVRGGVSSLYGSEGINGVIQIFTKKPTGARKVKIRESYGSFETMDSSLSFEDKTGPVAYRLFLNNAESNGLRENDDFTRNSWSSGFTFGCGANSFDLNLQGSEMKNGLSIGMGGITDTDDRQNDHSFLGSFSWDWKIGANERLNAKIHSRTSSISYFAPSPFGLSYSMTKNRDEGFEAQYNRRLKKVDAVIGVLRNQNDSSTEFPDWMTGLPTSASKEWNTNAAFINTLTSLNNGFSLSMGARYDVYSNFDNQLNPKFTLTKTFDKKTTAYISAGKNFRAPTFVELYYPNFGNPNLNPEYSTYRELGLKYELSKRLSFSISGYNYRYRDLIETVLVNPLTFQYAPMNVSRARINGVEIETVNYPGHNVEYTMNYTHLDTMNYDTRMEIRRAPGDQFSLRTSYSGKSRWGWALTGKIVSSAYDTKPASGYSVFDGKATYRKSNKCSYFLEANNILDNDYQMVVGYPAAGVSLRAGLSKEF